MKKIWFVLMLMVCFGLVGCSSNIPDDDIKNEVKNQCDIILQPYGITATYTILTEKANSKSVTLKGYKISRVEINLEGFENLLEDDQYKLIQEIELSKHLKSLEVSKVIGINTDKWLLMTYILSNGDTYSLNVLNKNILEKNGSKYYSISEVTDNIKINLDEKLSDDEKGQAVAFAQQIMKDYLTSPKTAKFPWGFEDYKITKTLSRYKVSGKVTNENNFGAKVENNFTVIFEYAKGNNYYDSKYVEINGKIYFGSE